MQVFQAFHLSVCLCVLCTVSSYTFWVFELYIILPSSYTLHYFSLYCLGFTQYTKVFLGFCVNFGGMVSHIYIYVYVISHMYICLYYSMASMPYLLLILFFGTYLYKCINDFMKHVHAGVCVCV